MYTKTREECEEKLAKTIEEVKTEISQQKELKQQSQSEMVTQ